MAAATDKNGLEDDLDSLEPLEGSIRNLMDKPSLRWIFVGGKGGVGCPDGVGLFGPSPCRVRVCVGGGIV